MTSNRNIHDIYNRVISCGSSAMYHIKLLGYIKIILSCHAQHSHNVCVGIILMARNRFFLKKKWRSVVCDLTGRKMVTTYLVNTMSGSSTMCHIRLLGYP